MTMNQCDRIRIADGKLTYYALEPGDGTRYCFAVGELDGQSGGLIRGCDADYALFVPLMPVGRAYAFRRGWEIEPGYWANKTDMDNEWTVLFLTRLWPTLTGGEATPQGIERVARDLVQDIYYGRPMGRPGAVPPAAHRVPISAPVERGE
jgi:hypothetical protein